MRFAIAGCGRIAARHAREISFQGTLVGVCEPDPVRLEAFCGQYGCRGYRDHEALLEAETPDVLVICSPNGLHAAQAIAALERGSHVLCEKPFALSSRDCLEVIDKALEQARMVRVVQSYRHHPGVQAVHNALAAGRLGKICSFQMSCLWNRDSRYYAGGWKGTRSLDGGILYTQFSHFMDLLYWFFGMPESVFARAYNKMHQGLIEFEDQGDALLEFEGGVSGSLHYSINAYRKNLEGSLTLLGETGTVRLGGAFCGDLEYQQLDGIPLVAARLDPSQAAHHDLVYRDFMQAYRSGNLDLSQARDSMHTVELIEKIYRAGGAPA